MEKLASRRVVFKVAVAAAVLLQLLHAGAVVQEIASCSTHCGNISISYPFGIEPGCYHLGFNLSCDHSHNPPKLFLGDGTVEVLGISIPSGTVCINSRSIVPLSVPNAARWHDEQDREVPHMDWPQKGWPVLCFSRQEQVCGAVLQQRPSPPPWRGRQHCKCLRYLLSTSPWEKPIFSVSNVQ